MPAVGRSQQSQQVAGEAQRRRRRRGALGAEEHPAGGEPEPGVQHAVAVLVRAAGLGVRGGELCGGECVRGGGDAREQQSDQEGGAGDAGRHAGDDEDPRADDRAEADADRVQQAEVATERRPRPVAGRVSSSRRRTPVGVASRSRGRGHAAGRVEAPSESPREGVYRAHPCPHAGAWKIGEVTGTVSTPVR